MTGSAMCLHQDVSVTPTRPDGNLAQPMSDVDLDVAGRHVAVVGAHDEG